MWYTVIITMVNMILLRLPGIILLKKHRCQLLVTLSLNELCHGILVELGYQG